MLERAKLAANEGIRPPKFAYQGALEQAKNILRGQPFDQTSSIDSPLWADAKSKIKLLLRSKKTTKITADKMEQASRDALINQMAPAYQQLIAWLQSDMASSSQNAQGASSLPNGISYYAASLRKNTTLEMTSEDIHQLGLSEVARIRAEMISLKEKVNFDGDLPAFFSFIKSDQQFFYPNDDSGRDAYLSDSTAYLGFIKSKLPEYFGLLPKAELVVKRVEAFREQDGAAQHYFSGTPDGSRPGVYYAHLSNMDFMPKDVMEAIAYHEGNPGHHMQISIAQELTGIPEFRTQVGFTSYIEGWGLYAEGLAKEMGAYENPYTDFGRLVSEMWRAIRLVVDTGIHTKGWSEQQAVNFFQKNSSISDGQIKSEVQRYFVNPGQATAYKIGMLKIFELRARAKTVLGEKFDIRAFHDIVLGGGSLPLPILEKVVNKWISETKHQ